MTFLGLAVGFGAGLVVGWNFLPQPNWVRKLFGFAPKEPVE